MSLTSLMLRQYEDTEAYLDKIVQTQLARTTNVGVIYTEYNNLFLHCIKTNLNRVNNKEINARCTQNSCYF